MQIGSPKKNGIANDWMNDTLLRFPCKRQKSSIGVRGAKLLEVISSGKRRLPESPNHEPALREESFGNRMFILT
jgi:hypothetical protein